MIKLLRNYPYDNKYDYIKLFSTKTEQTNYFSTYVEFTIDMDNDDSYIKEGETFIIEYNYDYLVTNNINYLIFNNGYKDLFCFIIKKEYVDEENTRIYYEIDVMNTYHFDYTINNSFVERKVCTIDELTDYDEGLNLGEHSIVSEIKCFDKDSTYFAMFNGMKEQQLIFENGQLKNVVQMPFLTNKPLTYIDDIQYPLFFMPLRETYAEPIITEIPTGDNVGGSLGDWKNGKVSAKGFRFMKGYEGFGKYAYDDGYGYMTIGYGVTLHAEPSIYNDLKQNEPVPEERGARVSYDLKTNNYGSKIVNACIELGITKQNEFDALCDLAFNCGYGVVTNTSNSLMTAIKNGDRENIRETWHRFYITSNGQASEGLELRRKAEAKVFLDNIYEFRDIVTINADGRYDGVVTENEGNGWLPS